MGHFPVAQVVKVKVQLLLILNLSTRWGWVVSVMPWLHFTPGERTPGTHCTGGWVGPRAGLNAEARRKILCLCWGLNPSHPVCSQTLYWLSYPSSSLGCILHKCSQLTSYGNKSLVHEAATCLPSSDKSYNYRWLLITLPKHHARNMGSNFKFIMYLTTG
jgi:hypothetical protein